MPEPWRLRALEVAGVVPVVAYLGWAAVVNWSELRTALPILIPWLIVVGLADLLPVPIWGSVELTISFPVLLAAAMVFPPPAVCLLGFIGPADRREFTRDIGPLRGLFNRANIAASVLAASVVFTSLGGSVTVWPEVLPVAFVALVVDLAVNASLVVFGTHLLTGVRVSSVTRGIYGGDRPLPFLVGYACFGLLAIVLATLYVVAGSWGLVAFSIPLLLARQMFVHWKRLGDAYSSLSSKERALATVSQRIADERREERLAVAAGLHDEVLPPLYQVHLMGQVLRQDLAAGQLLELEDDLPELLKATEVANDATRALIRQLRDSPIGSKGLAETLRLLAAHLSSLTTARIDLDLEEIGGPPISLLLTYQIAREALTNASRHAQASEIRLVLGVEAGNIRLLVQDDGRGFDPASVDRHSHFGLQLMRERVELAGGVIVIDTEPSRGTTVTARLPIEVITAPRAD